MDWPAAMSHPIPHGIERYVLQLEPGGFGAVEMAEEFFQPDPYSTPLGPGVFND
jgi:hypothetical protein